MTSTKRHGFKPSVWQTGICAGILLLIAGCDPTPNPWYGSCNDIQPCTAYAYSIVAPRQTIDSASGAYLVTAATWTAYFTPDLSTPALARHAAIAMSCIPCTGNLTADSAYFTTDLVTPTHDTVKAGTNLLGRALPSFGIYADNGSVTIDSIAGFRFRDSLFEIHFSGIIDSVRKSASAKFRVADTTLLLR